MNNDQWKDITNNFKITAYGTHPYNTGCVLSNDCCKNSVIKNTCNPTFLIETDIESAQIIIINNERKLLLKAKEKNVKDFCSDKECTYNDSFIFDLQNYKGTYDIEGLYHSSYLHPYISIQKKNIDYYAVLKSFHIYEINGISDIEKQFNVLKVCETCTLANTPECEKCPLYSQRNYTNNLSFSGSVLIQTGFTPAGKIMEKEITENWRKNSYSRYWYNRTFFARCFWLIKTEPINFDLNLLKNKSVYSLSIQLR